MSVKQAVNFLSQQRVDVVDLKAIDSSVIFDFKTLIKAFADDTPYILEGFTIPVSGISGPATALQLVVDSAVVWIPDDINGSMLRVEAGTSNEVLSTANAKVIGSFTAGFNYIGIQFNRATDESTADLVSFWDVDSETEFTQTVPRGLVMNYQIVISNVDFGNTAPVAIVNVSGSNVLSIENAKQGMWRLGTGGANPDINYQTTFTTENPLLATSNSAPDPFIGGDWDFKTLKDWANAVMSRLKQIDGSAFWYMQAGSAPSGLSLTDVWFDALGSVFTGAGKFAHSLTTAGQLTWTAPLFIKSIIGPMVLTIDTSASPLLLANGDVAYILIIRDEDFQPTNTFTFTNGSATITATIPVVGIVAGDWVKFNLDTLANYNQVLSVVGSTITLVSPYNGSTGSGKALRTQGTYVMQQANGATIPNSADVYWVAKRDDNAVATATITAASRTSDVVTFTTSASHNFVVGKSVIISGMTPSSFNGTFDVATVPLPNQFTINQSGNDEVATVFGTAQSAAVIYLKYFGELIQGEDRHTSDTISNETLEYIGASSQNDSVPDYNSSATGSLVLPNYNSSAGENLTKRISKLTAMLADTNQNFNMEFDAGLVTWDGSMISLTGAQMSIPGTTIGAAPVSINAFSGALAADSALYISLSRTSGVALTLASATIASLTPAQQQLIVARNVGGNIWLR